MIQRGASYDDVYAGFRWELPERLNIGAAVCDRHADGSGRLALVYEAPDGAVQRFSYDDLKGLSNRCANALAAMGVGPGDRVGVLLPQRPETAIAHIAIYKLGAVALPLFTQFGPDALEHRLGDSGARALITDGENLAKVPDGLADLATILVVDGDNRGNPLFWPSLERAADEFSPVNTGSDDPALVIYTSGTTGKPKGALHAHRVLLGHLPGVQLAHDFFPASGDFYWTPADWAWIGGLLDVLLPSLYFGIPVLAHRARKFDPEEAFALMARRGVRNAFLPPTALKMMRQVPAARERFGHRPRSVASGGEALGEDILGWCRKAFGVEVNEFYGQTEANLLVGNCASLFPVRPGSMGRATAGHRVEIVTPDGQPVPAGKSGIIAVRRPDPVMFLGYWNNPAATCAKFAGDWCLTGDVAVEDGDGYIWYKGREDDVISSGGYRIGPTDIEDCLMKHPAVLMAAVVGSPDPIRGEIVKAFVVAKPEVATGPGLSEEIRNFVGARLAHYQAPREVVFVPALPLTATGKIMRRELRNRPPG
ncbi:MAG: acyl-CoA synthetase [Alphaproteobacteria bacterium]|nr:acyl-CoA synthetase [Alphaproteobacteria bacterium]